MGRIDRSQSSLNYNTNQPQFQPAAPNPPQPPQGYHPHPYLQATHVPPVTIGIMPPPPYESTYHTANVNQQHDTVENDHQNQQHFCQQPPQPSPTQPTQPVMFPPQPVPFPPPSPQMATARSFHQARNPPQARINRNQSFLNYNNQPQFQPAVDPPQPRGRRQVTEAGPDIIDNVPPPPNESTYHIIDDNQQDKAEKNDPNNQQHFHQQQPAAPQLASPIHPTQLAHSVTFPPHQPVPFPPPSPHMGRAETFPQATNLPLPLSGGVMGFPPMQIPASPVITMGAPVDIPVTNAYTIVTPITNEWRTGLLDCMLDPEIAIMTTFFPCVAFGQIAEIVDKGDTSCWKSGQLYVLTASTAMPWLLSSMYRAKLRKRYGIKESPAADWAVHLFCEWCALCQEYRELKCRGMDPSVGWHGNMGNDDQNRQVTMTPPVIQTMMG